MSEKRRDSKNRILRSGESQRKDGRYAYKYVDTFGKPQFVYAWKLVPTDKTPAGKREDISLREKEKEIQKDLDDGIDPIGKKMSVCQLYAKQNRHRGNVRHNTVKSRERLMKLLESDPLGACPIESVKMSDAKEWALRMRDRGIAYRTIRSIENSDVCILMLDATRGIEGQDLNIFSLIQRNQKGLVVVVNKWDLVENKNAKVMKTYEEAIRSRLAPFVDFPIIFASALTKQRIFKVLETAKEVYQARTTRIPTARLNEEMLPLIEAYPPPSNKGKYIKIKYCTQLPNTQVPSFVFFANLPQYVKEPYKRFLENKIREKWNLSGTPINIFIRQK